MVKLHLDQDGVLTDYDSAYRELTGGEPGEKGKVKADRFKSHPHFYLHLPWLPDGKVLWNFCKPYHPSILSASSNYLPFSKQDKLDWCAKELHLTGPKVIIVKNPQDKWKHCTPGAILVDDRQSNCDQWVKAGGVAVFHTSAAQSIRELKVLLHHQEEGSVETPNLIETFQQLSETPCDNLLETFGQR